MIPINPGSAGKDILGEKCYASLTEMHAAGIEVDMVDCFQKVLRCTFSMRCFVETKGVLLPAGENARHCG